jgi:hypothetical protein
MKRSGESRSQWISRIAKELRDRRHRKQKKEEDSGNFRKRGRPMMRRGTPTREQIVNKLRVMIAYDLETSSIREGTPRPLYLTACGPGCWFSGEIKSLNHLCELLVTRFLIPDFDGARFVAWNGNKFDVYFIALALLKSPDYILRPYLTQSKGLRGLRVIQRQFDKGVEITNRKGVKQIAWEFLDGIAMTKIEKPLKSKTVKGIKQAGMLATFAPEYDWEGGPDFENEDFDPKNPEHVRYAERDSEGLYVAMEKIRGIIVDNFHTDLSPTIGNMAIKIFQRFIPKTVECWKPPVEVTQIIRSQVMRGGFCFIQKKYRGPIAKADLNQAYAAAMRDTDLPAGHCVHSGGKPKYATCYIARIRATNPANRIPFYYRDADFDRSVFGLTSIGDTWLTSIEIEQLEREGWKIEFLDSWFWGTRFRMKDYVDTLERLRVGGGRNPKDAQGELMKYIGNSSYGKTVEQLDGLELVMSAEQPEGYSPYIGCEENGLQYIWFKISEPVGREYHQPQIGAFITAYVRMVVRRAALLDPDRWLYADTDCVVFSGNKLPVGLDIDPGRYGAWKIEDEGTPYIFAAKKVYASLDMKTSHAKGMSVRKLTLLDFENWFAGKPPSQTQIQRMNFVKVLAGADMFFERDKVGENLAATRKRAA